MIWKRFRSWLAALLLTFSFAVPAWADTDLELVLAIDASGSVNQAEYRLQIGGIAKAFLSPRIQRAVRSGPHGRIAVALVIWSDHAFPKFPSQWYVIDSDETAATFAAAVLQFQNRRGSQAGFGGGGTGIGEGVAFAIDMIERNGIEATRRIIDVSGDGVETAPWFGAAVELPQARMMAEARNITINGLAIATDFPKLDQWYRKHVRSGPGSFVIRANDFSDFGKAIEEKLWREISVFVGRRETDRKQAYLGRR